MRFACLRCGRPGAGPIGESAAAASGEAPQGCQSCHREKHSFDNCIALWTYDGLVRNAVVAAKYGSQVALADALGRRLGERIQSVLSGGTGGTPDENADLTVPDVITCVPSHLWRRVQRGAGGSRILAKSVARFLRPVWPDAKQVRILATTRQIKKQAWLGEKDRASNVQGAFRVTGRGFRSRHRSRLSGKHVLLIDDVMTTGATAGENARVLKLAGACRVTVAVVARAYTQ